MTVIDACALINLIKGGVLAEVLRIPSRSFAVGPQVRDECDRDRHILQLHLGKTLTELSDDQIPASYFFSLLDKYGLGLGETECLALAAEYQGSVCTDDRKARQVCGTELGAARVLGTIRLLREAVDCDSLSPERAVEAYEMMRASGAFLPAISQDFFT